MLLESKSSSGMKKEVGETISLDFLAHLTGFSIDFIKNELLAESDTSTDGLSLEELREAMLRYLDSTMMK